MSVDRGPKSGATQAGRQPDNPDLEFPRRRKTFKGIVLDIALPPSQQDNGSLSALAGVELDLSKAIKVIFINGRGNTGKTVLLRLIGELLLQSGLPFRLAACDLGSRAARRYFRKISTPETNEVSEIIAFIQDVIQDASETGRTYLIDMGAAGEKPILDLHEQSDLLQTCQDLGVTPVFIHMISTGVDDVSVLEKFVQCGLCPPSTALVFNEMGIRSGSRPESAFELVEAQPCVEQAVERGLPILRLPALDRKVATEVEARQLLYGDAAMGKVGIDKALGPLSPFDCSAVRIWRNKALQQVLRLSTWFGLPPPNDESAQ